MIRLRLLGCMLIILIAFTGCNKDNNDSTLEPVSDEAFVNVDSDEEIPYEKISMRIGLTKGTAAIGMAQLMKNTKEGTASNLYEFNIAQSEEEVVNAITKQNIDVAVVSSNIAAVLYNKNDKGFYMAAINAFGKISVIESGISISTVDDLKGKTIYCQGNAGTEAYVLKQILSSSGINSETDVTIVYKEDASEIIEILNTTDNAIAVMREPYVSITVNNNDKIRIALSINDLWNQINGEVEIISEVLIARKDYVDSNTPSFDEFLNEFARSVEHANASAEDVALVLDEYDIFNKEEISSVIEVCGLEYFESEVMQEMVEEYFKILYSNDTSSIGGNLPDSEFYYIHNLG